MFDIGKESVVSKDILLAREGKIFINIGKIVANSDRRVVFKTEEVNKLGQVVGHGLFPEPNEGGGQDEEGGEFL